MTYETNEDGYKKLLFEKVIVKNTINDRLVKIEFDLCLNELSSYKSLMINDKFETRGFQNTISMSIHSQKMDIIFDQTDENIVISFSTIPIIRLIKDYKIICENYDLALYNTDHNRLQTIDMARRSLHNEAAELIKDILNKDAIIEFKMARNLFTLIYLINYR